MTLFSVVPVTGQAKGLDWGADGRYDSLFLAFLCLEANSARWASFSTSYALVLLLHSPSLATLSPCQPGLCMMPSWVWLCKSENEQN
jgi:hypothetical protein